MASETFHLAFPDKERPFISYGTSFDQACLKHVKATFQKQRVYVVAANSMAKHTEALEILKTTLGHLVVGVRVGMKPHTLWSEIFEIVSDVKRLNADIIITIGGGTLTDAAKVITMAYANNVSTRELLIKLPNTFPTPQIPNAQPPTIPIICIPTSLSGGEYSDAGGATDDVEHKKYQFVSPIQGPHLVILDENLACSTPNSLWLPSGFRAIDHCIETLSSLKSDDHSDEEAIIGLKALVPGLLGSTGEPNAEARHKCQLGVLHSMAFISRGVLLGASHGIGHMLGPLGVGHGETSCILLPAVCKYNARYGDEKVKSRQKTALEVIWADTDVSKVLKTRGLEKETADLGDSLDAIVRSLGLPRTLKEVGVEREKLSELAGLALQDKFCETNPVPLTKKDQVMEILEAVLE